MNSKIKRVQSRAVPAILILNREGKSVYQNRSAYQMLACLSEAAFPKSPSPASFSQMLLSLCTEFKDRINKDDNSKQALAPLMNRIYCHVGDRVLFRSIPLRGSDSPRPTHLMVLIEPLIRQDQIRSENQEAPPTMQRETDRANVSCIPACERRMHDKADFGHR